jgi:ATP/maltotriose-dependent transcriptional regulator MalT
MRQALSMTEKFEGEDHDDLVPPLNSLGMIDSYRGRLDAARAELTRADTIASKRSHNDVLDQVLLNEADLAVATGDAAAAAKFLKDSKALLEAAYPKSDETAWRYAVWDTVKAELLAANGDAAQGQRMVAQAEGVIRQKYGPAGFYSLLAARRAQWIDGKAHPGTDSSAGT